MKKLILTTVISLFSILVYANEPPTWPLKQGAFGIGIHPNVSGNIFGLGSSNFSSSSTRLGFGISGRYSILDFLTAQLAVGLGSNKSKSTFSGITNTYKTAGTNVRIEAILPVRVIHNEDQAFIIAPTFGVGIFNGNSSIIDPGFPTSKSPISSFQVDLGVKTEWFIRNVAIINGPASIGLSFAFLGLQNDGGSTGGDPNFWIFKQTSDSFNFINSTLGFYYYFG